MNKVVGRVHAVHRTVQTGGIQHIARDNFSAGRDARAQKLRLPGQTANAPPLRFEFFEQAPADVAGGAGQQDELVAAMPPKL